MVRLDERAIDDLMSAVGRETELQWRPTHQALHSSEYGRQWRFQSVR